MPDNPARICAVITEETIEAARAAMNRASSAADLIELRLDYLCDFDFANPENLRALLRDKSLPVIITCRAVSEGGRQFIEDGARLRLLVEGARQLADYCDIEATYYAEAAKLSPDLSRLIVSYHNFAETPADIDAIYNRITQHDAAIHKIAVRANSVADSLAIFRLLDRAQTERRKLIALSMQGSGLITRVLGPTAGSFLTYASIEQGRESAPGQLTCEQLRNLYRVHSLSSETAITGIIGQPVAHSASPVMHNRAFTAAGLDYVYLPIEVNDVEEFFTRFVKTSSREIKWRARGFSVTIPHKIAVIRLLDEIDATAARVGAVNTVVMNEGKLTGYNTDVEGAMKPLESLCTLEGASCGVIGAGGAARAVVYGLIERNARVSLFARDTMRATALAAAFNIPVFPIDALEASDVQILINTTPVGMKGHIEDSSPVSREAFRNRQIAYDLVYNPIETRFLKEAREEGCQTISGIEMLIAQAALQFELWTGCRPPVDLMRAAALEKLAAETTTSLLPAQPQQ
jgi:3-dehydroquinate dehydratase/shikimate dehydrogenase